MAIAELTVADLADFKGKEELYFGYFAPAAIDMAVFLVKEVTGIHDLPDDDTRGQKLFKFASLELAFQFYTEQEFAEINVNPFSGETIGSYSYSKSQVARTVMTGDATDNIWLKLLNDYAQNVLGIGAASISSGGIIGPEQDGVLIGGDGSIVQILGPRTHHQYFDNIAGNEGTDLSGPRF